MAVQAAQKEMRFVYDVEVIRDLGFLGILCSSARVGRAIEGCFLAVVY
jgi:hypothetical protein